MSPADASLISSTSKDFSAPPPTFPRAILGPVLIEAFDYWMQVRSGATPHRTDLSPAGMVPFLKMTSLWDHDPQSGDFICRLAGTHVCEAAGRELRGVPLTQIQGSEDIAIRHNFEWVVGTGHANFVRRYMAWLDRGRRRYERLLLPLADDAGAIRHLMAVIVFDKR